MSELEHIKIDPLKLRAARGDRKLIDAARAVGISGQRLWNYENGHSEMPATIAAKLRILYRASIEKLTTADELVFAKMYSAA
jgi:predicted transcriptional regulator